MSSFSNSDQGEELCVEQREVASNKMVRSGTLNLARLGARFLRP
jgi:hypothetical protein